MLDDRSRQKSAKKGVIKKCCPTTVLAVMIAGAQTARPELGKLSEL
jgi:hypothetical protein